MLRSLPPLRAAASVALAAALLTGCSGSDPQDGPQRSTASSTASSSASPQLDQKVEGAGSREGDLPAFPDQKQGQLLGQFVNFALRPDQKTAGDVAFADRVEVGLGQRVRTTLSGSDLGNPRRWEVEADGFAGRSGRVSPLTAITEQASRAIESQQSEGIFVTVVGEHDQCAAAPSAPLSGYDVADQLAVMPGARSIGSCLDWFAVDIYPNDAGEIAAVRLDLFAR